jgi:endonuclease/exonuclease/phosphatase family metal-dependent hydrolase
MKMDFDFILLQEINPYFLYDKEYKIEDGPVHYFKKDNKNIYYHELKEVLSRERPDDPFWGTAIIANEKYKIINNHFFKDNLYVGLEYFGHESLMCYDFEFDNGNIITIINYYKKGDTRKAIYDENGKWTSYGKDYDYEENFFSNIFKIVNIVNEKNILIFAGDFNITKRKNYIYDKNRIIKKIECMKFENITKNIGSTMLRYDNQNDYIFVNTKYQNYIDGNNIEKVQCTDLSDHYGIRCKIKL